MTDGAVWDVSECLNIVKEITDDKAFNSSFYSLGIGNGCSENLVKGISDKGEGDFELKMKKKLQIKLFIY